MIEYKYTDFDFSKFFQTVMYDSKIAKHVSFRTLPPDANATKITLYGPALHSWLDTPELLTLALDRYVCWKVVTHIYKLKLKSDEDLDHTLENAGSDWLEKWYSCTRLHLLCPLAQATDWIEKLSKRPTYAQAGFGVGSEFIIHTSMGPVEIIPTSLVETPHLLDLKDFHLSYQESVSFIQLLRGTTTIEMFGYSIPTTKDIIEFV